MWCEWGGIDASIRLKLAQSVSWLVPCSNFVGGLVCRYSERPLCLFNFDAEGVRGPHFLVRATEEELGELGRSWAADPWAPGKKAPLFSRVSSCPPDEPAAV